MFRETFVFTMAAFGLAGFAVVPALAHEMPKVTAGVVKVMPLGTDDGEFCRRDRAMIFEDPDGTRILYNAGRSVRGPDDPRLGKIDVVLLSSVHGDHLGDRIQPEANADTCAKPKTSVKVLPNSNTAEIIAKKKARSFAGGEMRNFLRAKVKAAGGSPGQIDVLSFGGRRNIGGVTIAIVPVAHSNGIAPAFLDSALSGALKPDGLTAYVGPDNGFILTFSNGLVVYLSGDTGLTSDMETVVRGFYGAKLAVINMGGIFSTGPEEAAYAINTLIRPRAVIPQHANEPVATGGKLDPKSKTAKFISLVKGIPAHVPLSGKTMEFDGNAKCVKGC